MNSRAIVGDEALDPPAHEAVNSYFDAAADVIELHDEMRDALRRPARELAVQVPVRLDDGAIGWSGATGCSTTAAAARTRAASATTRPPTSTRSGPWRR